MKITTHSNRLKTYFELNSKLSGMSTSALNKLLAKNKISQGWGSNHLLKLSGKKIFVKKVPLTKKEYESSFDTKNIFNLPLYYNYGVGSAGLGTYRELLTHIKTTNWVLENKIENFPLMYHFRVATRKERTKLNRAKHNNYIKYWNNSKAIDAYIRERKKSPYEIILFLEHIPHTLSNWLPKNTDKIDTISKKMFKTFSFLRNNGIIHFDAHFANILTDGNTPYLTDFGLALDRSFNLSKKEIDFFKNHSHYDFGEYIGCVSMLLESSYHSLPQRKKDILNNRAQIESNDSFMSRQEKMLSQIDWIASSNIFRFSNNYFSFVKKHQESILLMNQFFFDLRLNSKKNTKFKNKKLRSILKKNSII